LMVTERPSWPIPNRKSADAKRVSCSFTVRILRP
jgi:hypothetical protein